MPVKSGYNNHSRILQRSIFGKRKVTLKDTVFIQQGTCARISLLSDHQSAKNFEITHATTSNGTVEVEGATLTYRPSDGPRSFPSRWLNVSAATGFTGDAVIDYHVHDTRSDPSAAEEICEMIVTVGNDLPSTANAVRGNNARTHVADVTINQGSAVNITAAGNNSDVKVSHAEVRCVCMGGDNFAYFLVSKNVLNRHLMAL